MMLSFECSLAVYEKQKCYMHRSAKYPTQLYYLLLHIKVQLSTHTHTTKKHIEGVGVQFHSFLTLALDGGQ